MGIKIRQQFSKREKFYHDLSSFCLFLREQINFSKAPLPQIAEKFQLNCSKDFAQVLDGLKGGTNGEYPKYLKEKGKKMKVTEIFRIICDTLNLGDAAFENQISDFFALI